MAEPTTSQGVSSTGYTFLGSILGLIALWILVAGSAGDSGSSTLVVFGVVVGAIGAALLVVGLVAKGVALGMDEHRRSR